MPSISVPIIDQLAHPSLGTLTQTASLGLFFGDGSLTPPQNPLVALTYGLKWAFTTVPAQLGVKPGNPNTYYERMIQLSSTYQLLSGQFVGVQYFDVNVDGGMYFWDEPLPAAVLYSIFPGVQLNFFWLQT